ncbi:MAG: TonB-dependent receptor [Acidobacteria bacterium]|nr:TonB-dependent receptor [Acidobacteriota bacterium]
MTVEILRFIAIRPLTRSSSRALGVGLWLLTSYCFASSPPQPTTLVGEVHDPSGAPIAQAQVSVQAGNFTASTTTGPEGEFHFPALAVAAGTVHVSAPGFSPAEQTWSPGVARLSFVLQVAAVNERIVVSATRSSMKLSEVPGSAVQLSSADVAATAALSLDDLLRQVPGFSLFRRISSRVANPTTQGVSLRGLGGTGPSRALVLEDGIPWVDPFGGWVYWDRIPRTEIASVEVFRGGSSNLYGSDALGGVVEIATRVPTESSFSADFSYGTEKTPSLSLWGGTVRSGWDLGAGLDLSRSDGYILVPTSERGLVDTAANSQHVALDTSIGYHAAENRRVFLRSSLFEESRHNGTRVQTNSTATGFWVGGVNAGWADRDSLSARLYGQAQGYDQTFSSVALDRNSERLNDIQHVPSQQIGGSLVWNHGWRAQTFIVGLDNQQIIGASDEQLISSTTGNHFANNIAGGRQLATGVFAEDIFRHGNHWTVIAGMRWDDWNNNQGSTLRLSRPAGPIVATRFPDRSQSSFNPRVSLLRGFSRNFSASLSAYRAFRAPTLNELYRSFQQGSVLTASNPFLRAERLTGAEAGVRGLFVDNKVEARATMFWSDIVDPVVNVTINTTPTLTNRQRQNLGRTRSLGTELDGSLHLSDSIELSAGYQYAHATVINSTLALIGLDVPEVPRHQFSWQARYSNPSRLMASIQGHYSSLQFDDDLNTLPLKAYYVMDLLLARKLVSGLEVYVAAENLLNQRYLVALSPTSARTIANLGPPILARAGLRWDFPGRQK